MSDRAGREVVWIASSLDDTRAFPDSVRQDIGFALYEAQIGRRHPSSKVLSGFAGAGVLEVIADYSGDTFRCIYTVKFGEAIYVLHAFQKKSGRGVATQRRHVDVIRVRLKEAQRLHAAARDAGRDDGR
jgi:phage-related protein